MKKSLLLFSLLNVNLVLFAQDKLVTSVLPYAYQSLFSTTEKVETKFFPSDSAWIKRSTFLLKNLIDYKPAQTLIKEDQYGGEIAALKYKSTGYFYTQKLDGRWWIIDPEGNKWYSKALVAITPNNSERGKKVMQDSFKTVENWALKTSVDVKDMGFNSAGAWSRIYSIKLPVENKMPYTIVLNIMSSFGYHKKSAYQGIGHTSFKDGMMPVFDPEFESFALEFVKNSVKEVKNDPWLIGYFSDNELNFSGSALNKFLKLPPSDPNYQPVKKWAATNNIDINNLTKANQDDFLEYYVEEYYRVVSSAIKKADPNHLFLSSRLHGSDKNKKQVFRAAGKYSDIISFNYYKSWYPEQNVTDMWLQESGKPFMITEWYAKGMDSGMPNETGWGWTVKTQEDRGKYYQNFGMALLANKNCVGWQWFKYLDNDPTGNADPSNKDSNKGIATWDYKPYPAMIKGIKELNNNTYQLVKYFDEKLK